MLSPNAKLLLAALAAGGGIVVSSRFRSDLSSQLALVFGFGVAQWLVTSAHGQRFPDTPTSAVGARRIGAQRA